MTDFSKRVVVKIGGSLLTHSNLPARIEQWLDQQDPSTQHIFIVGGGEAVDAIRRIDASNQLPEETTHWAAIAVMDLNANLLCNWLPSWPVIDEFKQLTHSGDTKAIFKVNSFLREQEPTLPGIPLPIGWQTTSDAIAARIVECLSADLILLKSIEVQEPYDWESLSDEGVIDPIMASMADRLSVRLETLPKLA